MASKTSNVKLGVCQILYAGVDLGYTKGGVEVSVETEKYEVNIDQFGITNINELIQGRNVTVTCPLAETTLENLVAVMPGATISQTGGTAATGTITVATNPANGNTITVNGAVVTFKTALANDGTLECLIGAATSNTAANLSAMLNASTDYRIATATYSVAASVVTVKYGSNLVYGTNGKKGVEGNSFTLATGGAWVTVSGATLTGGADPTAQSVSVATGTSLDLLSFAKELRLHPISKVITDKSEDFVIPLAATGGGLSFAYKFDEERVYSVEFKGYPDAAGKLFSIGL